MITPRCDDPILHAENDGGGTFYIVRRGERVAELTYTRDERCTTIDHTWIEDELRGSGCGRRLVGEIAQWARDGNLRLRASCPFARTILERMPEYADLR